jgi:hypothetical protein
MAKKLPLIWLINDDEGAAHYEREDILDIYPGATVKVFDDALSAWKATGSPEIIVIDISAVGSIMGGPHQAYSPICNVAGKHPGATIIINSAVSKDFSEEVRDLVKERCPDSVVEVVDRAHRDSGEAFKRILEEVF